MERIAIRRISRSVVWGALVVVAIASCSGSGLRPGATGILPQAQFGAPFAVNGYQVTVGSPYRPAGVTPLEGTTLWALDVTMVNRTGAEARIGTGFRIQDDNGEVIGANYISVVGDDLSATLANGGQKHGTLTFSLSVPRSPAVVIVQPGDNGDTVRLALTPAAPSIASAYPTPIASPPTFPLVSPSPASPALSKATLTPRPTPKPTPTLAPTESAWLKQYCQEVEVNLAVASNFMSDIYTSGSTGFILWNQLESQGRLVVIAADDAVAATQRLPTWPPAKKANALLVKAARTYLSTGSAFEQAGSDHSSSEYTSAMTGDGTIDAYHNANVEMNRLESAYGLGCY